MRDSMNRAVLLALTALLAWAPAGAARAQRVPAEERCRAITRAEVRALFDHWNAALATGNPDAVARIYAADAVLLPTVENGPLIGTDAIRGYFTGFLKKHPQGAIDQRTVHVGCNIAYDVGTYTFTVDGAAPGSREKVHARYTYIYAPHDGHWLIVHHHSSAMPQPVP
jgi:uncharacterized protein (TIGR02246 family)